MNKVYCDNCNWIGDADEVMKARYEIAFDDAVDVCPECNHPETICQVQSLWRKRQCIEANDCLS